MYKLAIIFTLKELGYRNKVIEDIFFTKYFTEYFSKNKFTVADNGRQKC